jgi:hypothetical protein
MLVCFNHTFIRYNEVSIFHTDSFHSLNILKIFLFIDFISQDNCCSSLSLYVDMIFLLLYISCCLKSQINIEFNNWNTSIIGIVAYIIYVVAAKGAILLRGILYTILHYWRPQRHPNATDCWTTGLVDRWTLGRWTGQLVDWSGLEWWTGVLVDCRPNRAGLVDWTGPDPDSVLMD